MRTVRIYQEGNYKPGQLIELSESAAHHVHVVLRMGLQDKITLFCGDNREFSASLQEICKKKVIVRIDDVQNMNRESPCLIHLAQGISKGDRMEWVVQKATELGVFSITPLITSRCSVKLNDDRLLKKQSQWQAIAISACEQSGRNQIPTIHYPLTLDVFIQQCQTKAKLILHPEGTPSWSACKLTEQDISLVIGPEGGLTDEEIALAISKQFKPLSIGPRVLRTETAAIAALSALQAFYGDW